MLHSHRRGIISNKICLVYYYLGIKNCELRASCTGIVTQSKREPLAASAAAAAVSVSTPADSSPPPTLHICWCWCCGVAPPHAREGSCSDRVTMRTHHTRACFSAENPWFVRLSSLFFPQSGEAGDSSYCDLVNRVIS